MMSNETFIMTAILAFNSKLDVLVVRLLLMSSKGMHLPLQIHVGGWRMHTSLLSGRLTRFANLLGVLIQIYAHLCGVKAAHRMHICLLKSLRGREIRLICLSYLLLLRLLLRIDRMRWWLVLTR